MDRRFVFRTREMVELFKNEYATTSNSVLAARLGINRRTVARIAKELQLTKAAGSKNNKARSIILNMFYSSSYSEMANIAGVTKKTAIKLAKELGLKNTPERECAIRSRLRRQTIKMEYTRKLLRCPPLTSIKCHSNKRLRKLREKLVKAGYLQGANDSVMLVPQGVKRLPIRERNARRMGITFIEVESHSTN